MNTAVLATLLLSVPAAFMLGAMLGGRAKHRDIRRAMHLAAVHCHSNGQRERACALTWVRDTLDGEDIEGPATYLQRPRPTVAEVAN